MAEIEFDPAKSARNLQERGIGFERFADMDFETAISVRDIRKDYGEPRLRVLGTIDGRLHAAVITPRARPSASSACGARTGGRNGRMRKNGSRPDAENPEWTSEDVRRARPLMKVLPKGTAEALRRYRGQRGPQRSPTKELISLRVDREVVAAYRATGPGWQKRATEALRLYAGTSGFSSERSPAHHRATSRTGSRERRTAGRS